MESDGTRLGERLQAALGDAYALERELGGGGMARVFVARDARLGRRVVVKVLHPDLSAGLSARRFEREVRLAARLQHPHVVPVHAAGAVDGLPFYTMPFVEGETLRARLAREGALPVADAVRLVRELADALAYAHGEGVVHRDLKPENVLLSGGHAVVADFGVAKALASATRAGSGAADGAAEGAAGAGDATATTALGMAVGTPAYMAPEQALGDPATDHRADLYALGVVAYEALAGRHPFAGRTPQQLVAAHVSQPPPPLGAARPDAPPALAALVMRLLEKDPDARPQTAGEALRALDALATPAAGAGPPPAPERTGAPEPGPARVRGARRRLGGPAAVLAGALTLALAAGGGWWGATRGDAGGRDAGVGAGPRRLAVLPFEEVGGGGGDSTAYVVDGMAEAVTARLAALDGLEVIDPRSTAAYRATRTPARQVGRELGVDYVLTGTVRWARGAGGARTARVVPTLVRAGPGTVAWAGAPYAVAAGDPFTAQAEIAGDVARALGVALTRGERRALAARPTESADAYDHYLRGLDAYRRWRQYPRRAELAQIAAEQFRLAARRDTAFALAHARLAQVLLESTRLRVGQAADSGSVREFHAALDRARRLDPDLPEAIVVHGEYLRLVVRDPGRAFQEFDRASALRPHDAELLARRVRYGRSPAVSAADLARDAALLERALRLDPRSPETLQAMVVGLAPLRRYADAEAYARRLRDVAPEGFVGYLHGAEAALKARGDTAEARAVLEAGLRYASAPFILLRQARVAGGGFARTVAALDFDQAMRGTRPGVLDSAWFYVAKLDAAERLHRGDAARAYADSARGVIESAAFQRRARERPVQRAAADGDLARVYAALGRAGEAARRLRTASRALDSAVAARMAERDTIGAGRFEAITGYDLARVAARLGDVPEMRRRLAAALAAPGGVTPPYVRVDPAFAAWRGRPEFEAVLAGAPSPAPRASTH